jgi:hypothetical protein
MKEYASTEEFLADIQQMINISLSGGSFPMPAASLPVPQQPERIIERVIVASGSVGMDTSARIMNILF